MGMCLTHSCFVPDQFDLSTVPDSTFLDLNGCAVPDEFDFQAPDFQRVPPLNESLEHCASMLQQKHSDRVPNAIMSEVETETERASLDRPSQQSKITRLEDFVGAPSQKNSGKSNLGFANAARHADPPASQYHRKM